ncbi:MAG: T9SS type A sorting domain-containing protein, partial [Proteobacteria bacterium]|nr:T9SS type A sorting domain-containing protein [Pseudomonadota bacterium]
DMSVNGIKVGNDTITVSKDVSVMAALSDKNGIALAGDKQIKLMIDNDVNKVYSISNHFSYNENSYTKGVLNYSVVFPDTGGIHSITLIVYDNMMNVSYKTAYLNIIGDENLSVRNVWNWPNPMKDVTYFTFVVSRNVSATIKVFTITGKCIRTIETEDLSAGYNQVYWDGRDNSGNEIAQGLYFYKILFKSADGSQIAVKNKLLVYR